MIKKLFLLLFVLAIAGYCDDATKPLELLYSGDKLFRPSSFLGMGEVPNIVSTVLKVTCMSGIFIVIFTIMAQGARNYLSGEKVTLGKVFELYGKHVFMAILVSSSTMWTFFVRGIVLMPSEAVTDAVKKAVGDQTVKAMGEALLAAAGSQYSGIGSLVMRFVEQGLASAILIILAILAIIVPFVVALYTSVMWTILFCIGPLLFPLVMFESTSQIGYTWLKSFLAFSLMGAVGSIFMGFLVGGGLLTKAVALGGQASLIPALAYSTIVIVMMAMVPSITLGLFGGVGANAMGAAQMIAETTVKAASLATAAAGIAAMGVGKAAQGAGKLGGKMGGGAAAGKLEAFGKSTANIGKAATMSQMSTLAKAREKGLAKTAFPTFSKFAGKGD